jgi:Tol biopolymer transport system component
VVKTFGGALGARFRPAALVGACLAALVLATSAHAAFPGTNGKIAFQSSDGTDSEIYVVNPDGSGETQLTSNTAQDSRPSWSPDGTKILFLSNRTGQFAVYVMNADGSGQTQLTFPPSGQDDNRPGWSPDGMKIVFGRGNIFSRPCSNAIWIANADGLAATQITPTGDCSYDPDWSPDGALIALIHKYDLDFPDELWTMKPDGTQLTQLSHLDGYGEGPSWSPDGRRIAWGVDAAGAEGLHVINRDGTGEMQAGDTGLRYSPAWSPDGNKVALRGTDGASAGIFVEDSSFTSLTLIRSGNGGEQPSWQPIPYTGYPRPKGATPIRVPLVPAYQQCTSPNRTHGSPLAFPSCNPPDQTSSYLTVGTPDANGAGANSSGYVRFAVGPGDPRTGTDEADVGIKVSLSDVRNKSDLSDYTGELAEQTSIRMTDKYNAVTGAIATDPATVEDVSIPIAVPCAASASTTIGSDCNLATTMDTVIPGTVTESKRSVWELGPVQVFDSGADGNPFSLADNTLFETQGVFVP